MWKTNVFAMNLGLGLTALSSSAPKIATIVDAVSTVPASVMRALPGKTVGSLPVLKTATTVANV